MQSSDDDFVAMTRSFKIKNYNWALFIGHLVLEKLFKAIYVEKNPQNPHPPFTHNLIVLSEYCDIETTPEMDEKLGEINSFNISARYEDEHRKFFRQCTKEYTEEQIEIIKEIREWLKEKLMQK